MDAFKKVQEIGGNTEADIIDQMKMNVAKGPSAIEGYRIRVDNWLFAGFGTEAPYADGKTVVAIESSVAGETFLEVAKVKVTGRGLWSAARKRDGIDGPAIRIKMTITTDEGETFTDVTGWIF